MSLGIAIQSAVWYYLSCTPCNRLQQDHHRRAEARKARQERERRIITEQPAAYRHPEANHTNPYWAEEIRAGPNPPPKKGARANGSQRRLDSSGRDSSRSSAPVPSLTTASTAAQSLQQLDTAASQPKNDDNNNHDYHDDDADATREGKIVPPWNVPGVSGDCHGQQLDDQQSSVRRVVDALYKAGTSAGRFVEETLGIEKPPVTEAERSDFYFGHRNPSVNDLHPPVVSAKSPHPALHRWMIEPPPPARIMEGRVPMRQTSVVHSRNSGVNGGSAGGGGRGSRSSANSRGSTPLITPTTDDPPPFDRTLLEKRLEESARMARGPSEEELINSLIGQPQTKSVIALTKRRSFSGGSGSSASNALRDLYVDGGSGDEKRTRPRRASNPPSVPVEKLPIPLARRVNSDRVTGKTTMAIHAAKRPTLKPILSSRTNVRTPEPSEKIPTTPSSSGSDATLSMETVSAAATTPASHKLAVMSSIAI